MFPFLLYTRSRWAVPPLRLDRPFIPPNFQPCRVYGRPNQFPIPRFPPGAWRFPTTWIRHPRHPRPRLRASWIFYLLATRLLPLRLLEPHCAAFLSISSSLSSSAAFSRLGSAWASTLFFCSGSNLTFSSFDRPIFFILDRPIVRPLLPLFILNRANLSWLKRLLTAAPIFTPLFFMESRVYTYLHVYMHTHTHTHTRARARAHIYIPTFI